MSQLLYAAAVWLVLLLPSLRCDNLLCYYSPILEKEKEKESTFRLILTECPPDALCFKADGRYGNHSALSARGCMAERECGQAHSLPLKGTVYTMSYACCDWPYCNSCPCVTAKPLPLILTLTLAVILGSL
ncbi:protein Bouncer [Centroberyx gerrardi]|uniref:protein Bouncer n=1 Tax=Centroberyx gerrardi TaxID=166262 RepID=UPI003AAB6BD6